MARTKKSAAPVTVPQTDAQAATQLRQLGDVGRARDALKADAEKKISAIQDALAQADTPLKIQSEALSAGLQMWASSNRERLAGKTKTIRLSTGALSWRKLPPSVSIGRNKLGDVIDDLAGRKWERFLRRSVKLDKEAMLKERKLFDAIDGVTIGSEGEEFICEPYELEPVK